MKRRVPLGLRLWPGNNRRTGAGVCTDETTSCRFPHGAIDGVGMDTHEVGHQPLRRQDFARQDLPGADRGFQRGEDVSPYRTRPAVKQVNPWVHEIRIGCKGGCAWFDSKVNDTHL